MRPPPTPKDTTIHRLLERELPRMRDLRSFILSPPRESRQKQRKAFSVGKPAAASLASLDALRNLCDLLLRLSITSCLFTFSLRAAKFCCRKFTVYVSLASSSFLILLFSMPLHHMNLLKCRERERERYKCRHVRETVKRR